MAERDHGSVKLYSRNGYDFAERFPLAAAAIRKLPVRSCLIDGEAIVRDANGLAVFDLLRRWSGTAATVRSSTSMPACGLPCWGIPLTLSPQNILLTMLALMCTFSSADLVASTKAPMTSEAFRQMVPLQ